MDISRLIQKLAIVDENVYAEAAMQPRYFIRAARYRVGRMRLTARAEARLEDWDASLSLRIRGRATKRDERTTEPYVKARIAKNPLHVKYRDALNEAKADEEFSKLLLEAFRHRRDALEVIGKGQFYEGMRETAGIERESVINKLKLSARQLDDRRKRRNIR